jgi:hypothetical protein
MTNENRLRSEKVYFWSFVGTVKEFREALKLQNKTIAEVFEPVMQREINKAKKI